MMNESCACLMLLGVPGIGRRTLWQILETSGSAIEVLQGRPKSPVPPRMMSAFRSLVDAKKGTSVRLRIERLLEEASSLGYQAVPITSASYPERLRTIFDPPIVLWVMGEIRDPEQRVAIVGTRRATSYGKRAAREIARDLAIAGVTTVSGLAFGIDSAAHEATALAGGRTIAVLGSAIELVVPKNPLAVKILDTGGALVSEYPPGTGGAPHHFPERNRIISGLSDLVCVVEAPARSGALITVDFALEQGRDVMAVPGSVFSETYEGCHALLRDGASLAAGASDVLRAIGRGGPGGQSAQSAQSSLPLTGLSENEIVVIRALQQDSGSREAISANTGLSETAVAGALSMLEIKGFVKRQSDGVFEPVRVHN